MKKHTLNCLVFVTVNARRFTAVTNACRCGCRYSPGAARSDLQTEAFGISLCSLSGPGVMRLVMKTLQDQSRGEYEYSPTAAIAGALL